MGIIIMHLTYLQPIMKYRRKYHTMLYIFHSVAILARTMNSILTMRLVVSYMYGSRAEYYLRFNISSIHDNIGPNQGLEPHI